MEDNNFCKDIDIYFLKTLDSCCLYNLKRTVIVNNISYKYDDYIKFFFETTDQTKFKFKVEYKNYNIQKVWEQTEVIKNDCIFNSKLYKLVIYLLHPILYFSQTEVSNLMLNKLRLY